jgi:peptide-methionine (S)-S-oxide reductase
VTVGKSLGHPLNFFAWIVAGIVLASSCGSSGLRQESGTKSAEPAKAAEKDMDSSGEKSALKEATFGEGCFWCMEAIFQRLQGVEKVVSGYSGGHVANPTYEQVCTGNTGHAEICQITYDPARISYDELLEVFWKTHDPTTLNRQGNDVGTQYRSVIFYHDDEQRQLAESYKAKLASEHVWKRPIVTEVTGFEKLWPAEAYHKDYYNNNPDQGYCRLVITPKLEKFEKIFKDRLRSR